MAGEEDMWGRGGKLGSPGGNGERKVGCGEDCLDYRCIASYTDE